MPSNRAEKDVENFDPVEGIHPERGICRCAIFLRRCYDGCIGQAKGDKP